MITMYHYELKSRFGDVIEIALPTINRDKINRLLSIKGLQIYTTQNHLTNLIKFNDFKITKKWWIDDNLKYKEKTYNN